MRQPDAVGEVVRSELDADRPRTIAASSTPAITVPINAKGAIIHLRRFVGSSVTTATGMNTGSTTKANSR